MRWTNAHHESTDMDKAAPENLPGEAFPADDNASTEKRVSEAAAPPGTPDGQLSIGPLLELPEAAALLLLDWYGTITAAALATLARRDLGIVVHTLTRLVSMGL